MSNKAIYINKENNITLIRVIISNTIYNSKHNNIIINKDGVFRVYYTDNQKRFPVMEKINDI